MRLALFANERSGAGAARRVAELLGPSVATVLDFDAVCSGDVTELPGIDRLVAAGGDGSLGPAALLAARVGVPLAVVPAGTANSFARWLGLPLDVEEAAQLAARRDASTTTVEVADADGRPFVNLASTGLPVLAAHRARPLKRRLGPLAYAAGAVWAGLTGRPLDTAVRVLDGDIAWRGAAWQVAVAATGAFGGGSGTGGVDPGDERLDVAIVQAGARWHLVRHAWAMSRGRLVREDDVTHVRAGAVELDVPPQTEFNVDGEVLRLERPRFSVAGTLEVVTGAP